MTYERLFSPLKVGGLTLKNRVIMPALHHLYTPEGYATDRLKEYYWRRAEGGPALVIVGGCKFDDYGASPAMLDLSDDKFIPGYKEFTDGMHRRDTLVGVQLYHAGAYTKREWIGGKEAIAPSAVFSKFSKQMPREMTREEIRTVIQREVDAALRAKAACFDLVEVLGSAGYLINQFLSPIKNLRTDEYGGSWENRLRFPRELVTALRKALGPDFALCMRVAGNDFVPGSNDNEVAVEFCKEMEKCGIDLFNVTGGWHETTVPQLPGELPRGGFYYLAAAIKDAVGVPVAASNRINDPVVAEKFLALGISDLVCVGRGMLADPDWVNKARCGRADEIRHCVACNQGCLARTFFGKAIECLVNAECGREAEFKERPSVAPKKILVVGGGPAGCEFALRARQRGHNVTLWEKESRLGGQIYMASTPPGKSEFNTLIKFYQTMLAKTGVEVTLGKKATAFEICNAEFDEVVIATGMKPRLMKVQNDGTAAVTTAYDILEGNKMAGRCVLIIGGGSVGCETAQYLASEGAADAEEVFFLLRHAAEKPEKILHLMNTSRRTVTIADIASIGTGFEPGTGWPVMKDLSRLHVERFPFHRLERIENGTAILKNLQDGGTETTIPCDTIVLAVGAVPERALEEELEGFGLVTHTIGDAKTIGRIIDATRQAAELAQQIC